MGRDNKLNHSNLVPRVSGCTGVTDVVFVPKEGQSSGNKYHQGPACCAKTRHPIFFFFFFVLIRIGYGAFIICYIHDSFFLAISYRLAFVQSLFVYGLWDYLLLTNWGLLNNHLMPLFVSYMVYKMLYRKTNKNVTNKSCAYSDIWR